MRIMKNRKKPKKKSLNILNYIIIITVCTLRLVIFYLLNLKNKIHVIFLTLCPQKLDFSKEQLNYVVQLLDVDHMIVVLIMPL